MGDTEAIRAYLGAGGCPNAPDKQGRTPLIFAAGYGRAAAAQLLLSADACTAAPASGTTPLHRLWTASLRVSLNISEEGRISRTALPHPECLAWCFCFPMCMERGTFFADFT